GSHMPRDYTPICDNIVKLTLTSDGKSITLYGLQYGNYIITNRHLFRLNNGTLTIESKNGTYTIADSKTLEVHLIEGKDLVILKMPDSVPAADTTLKFKKPVENEEVVLVSRDFSTPEPKCLVSESSKITPDNDGTFWKHSIPTKDGEAGLPLVSTKDGTVVGLHSASNFNNTNFYFTAIPENFMELLNDESKRKWIKGWHLTSNSVEWGGHKVFMDK
uniref:TEV protease-like hydrolase n=1 Tax=Tobacco etch virus TaxID=12227 RepID=A0AC62AEM6_TEV